MPVEHCETCDQPRRMLLTVAAWYGAHWTCLTCGEQWDADEGRKERPFMPAWRRKNVEEAKSFWKRHVPQAAQPSEVCWTV